MIKKQTSQKISFGSVSFAINCLLDLKKKAEQEAQEAIESGNEKEIEALQSSMDEGKISALIKVSI